MQFVKDGPEVPDRLLQAHEEGRVVFFCGAGISYPAGLPGFKGLVEELSRRFGSGLGLVKDIIDDKIADRQYDKAIDLLDQHVADGRQSVRKAIADILLKPERPDALDTHRSLLALGKCPDGRTRLVTTNFDRLFELAISRDSLLTRRFEAPALPVPKQRWDGLVYLHGLLPEKPGDSQPTELVVSSGDFGLAYLSEGWAARFVSELLREFTVCFVGYSIEDPVMRYMVDALAADRLRGELPREMFAFGDCPEDKETEWAEIEWRSRSVMPIVYRDDREHAALHETIRAWAAIYRDGVRGKERIIEEEARGNPDAVTGDDNFVGRVLWALRDPSGLPAKRFAKMDASPPLNWLDHLNDMISLAGPGTLEDSHDKVKVHLSDWLTRHLDKHDLLLRLAAQGGKPHWLLADMIAWRLREPSCAASGLLRKLWGLVLAGRTRGQLLPDIVLDDWEKRFERDGLTTALRLELREKLAPCVSLSPAPHNEESLSALLSAFDVEQAIAPESEDFGDEIPQAWQQLLEPNRDIVLASSSVHAPLRSLGKSGRWKAALPALLDDFTGLLRDTLELMCEIGIANDRNDTSDRALPSIYEHPQNLDLYDWAALIKLNRDAWLATAGVSPERALAAAEGWARMPYPVFRRLAFFAAAQQLGPIRPIPPERSLDWLLADEHWWLWAVNTSREACRLLAALSPCLDADGMNRLEQAVLAGPPRGMYRPGLEGEAWTRIMQCSICLRLARMNEAGAALSADARRILDELSVAHPDLELTEDGRKEVSFSRVGARAMRPLLSTPRREGELTAWLRTNPGDEGMLPEMQDDWRERCRNDFDATAAALKQLAAEGTWQPLRWREAMQAWSVKEMLTQSWNEIAPAMEDMPRETLQKIPYAVSGWLKAVAGSLEGREEVFLSLCERVLALDYGDEGSGDKPVTAAINHPVGQTAEALLRWWYRAEPRDGQGLEEPVKSIFGNLCDREEPKFRHGRVLLAAHAVALFRVDPDWTAASLLPFFAWEEPEAAAVWTGFLWSPRLHRPLMEALKPEFLAAARHYERLGRYGRQYAALLTFAALDRVDSFSEAEFADATGALPQNGRADAANTLFHAVDSAGDRREEYWRNRAAPWLEAIWPKGINRSEPVSNCLARACIAAGSAFPEALEQVKPWLLKLQYPDRIVAHALHESEMGCRFPCAALELLDKIVSDEAVLYSGEVRDILMAVRAADPALADDRRFRRLVEIVRKNRRNLDD